MLNRIYIIVGMLAIVVLAGAFIVPRFIQWGDYRVRMEELATGMLGTPVSIRGDIDFSLLPQPRLIFTNVLVGSPEEPAATVDTVEAEFSLVDFLRDDYQLTSFVLDGPVVDFTVDESGLFGSGVTLASDAGGVGLGATTIRNATLRLFDRRTGHTVEANGVDGELRLSSMSGPLQFQGAGNYGGERYSVRFNSSVPDSAGVLRVSAFVNPQSGAFSFSAEGQLTPGMAPKLDGTMVYRQAPPAAEAAEDIQGDLVLEARVTGSTDRIVLTGYTLQPDENRAGTRLTGAASIQLGERLGFDAVISGGVFSLPPRDADEDPSQPYELVRLLGELPAPPTSPIPGRVGLDLAEVGLRAFALRDVRLDASTDGEGWTIETLEAELPGDTRLALNGTLLNEGGRPAFSGEASLASERLDALSALWRRQGEENTLFGVEGSFDGRLMLAADALGIIDGTFTIDGQAHAVDLRIGFGEEKRLDLTATLGDLDGGHSTIVGALLPVISADDGFALSFPTGSFSLEADGATILGQPGKKLVAKGAWSGGAVQFDRLAAESFGGLAFDLAGSAGGTLAALDLSGRGSIDIPTASAPALAALYDALGVPPPWRAALGRSLPAELELDLEPHTETGLQALTLRGTAGSGQLTLRASLDAGLSGIAIAPLHVTASLEGEDGAALAGQLGFGAATPFSGGDAVLVSASLDGSAAEGFAAQLTGSYGDSSLGYSGRISIDDAGTVSGEGTILARAADASAIAAWSGATGVHLPTVSGEATLTFDGDADIHISDIAAEAGGSAFSGAVSLSRSGGAAVVSGELQLDQMTVAALAAAGFGDAALIPGLDVWPEGPIDIGAAPRTSRGSVTVRAPLLLAGPQRWTDASLEFGWDETRIRLAKLSASLGDGTVDADITVCCSGPLPEKTVTGRASLSGLAIGQLDPGAASNLGGSVDGVLQVEGTGASIADVLGALAGEGSFTIADFTASQLSPAVYPAVAGIEDALTLEADALQAIVGVALGQGPFTAPTAGGAFTIAGGVLRLANLIVEGEGALLSGSLDADLRTLALDGGFVLTPRDFTDPDGLVQPDTARILTRIAGTALAPEVTLDLDELVAAIQVRANEIEVDRLEELRLADEARQRAAAEERNRLIEAQRQQAAAEAAARAAAEAAAQPPVEEPQPAPPNTVDETVLPEGPLDLNLNLPPPQVNQPLGSVNQPF